MENNKHSDTERETQQDKQTEGQTDRERGDNSVDSFIPPASVGLAKSLALHATDRCRLSRRTRYKFLNPPDTPRDHDLEGSGPTRLIRLSQLECRFAQWAWCLPWSEVSPVIVNSTDSQRPISFS